ncbi:unnamed protein product [Nyctereutes procyonoides]|uniref:(raccoon dog) hypothetical protein n=1 Tax=Nyctereutes procyonoides TaxID=34880 RepID=A0A812A146_NYCPR|nr:unnamed protein product [Nyctereutes procyonoides]
MSSTTRSPSLPTTGPRAPCSPSHRVQPISSTASVYAGMGGSSSRTSISCSTSFPGGWRSGGPATGMAGGLAGIGGIQGKKETMQDLSDRLASYLERVRDRGHDFKTTKDLRAQIFASAVDNARIVLQIGNARLAADDFRVKYEMELAMRQSVESDIHGLCRVIDDTNVTRLQLETEIEALKAELLFMKKNHEEQGTTKPNRQLWVDGGVGCPQISGPQKDHGRYPGPDHELAQKNWKELDKYWSQQIKESTTVVTTQTSEIGEAEMTLMELRCTTQSLKINLDSMRNLKASLENSLREVKACYAMQMEQLNGILLHLESELSQTRVEGQRQAQEYEALLNVKVKLEAEIATDCRLLEDGEDFSLTDALDNSNSLQTIQKTTTRKIVDSKVVSETDTKILRH